MAHESVLWVVRKAPTPSHPKYVTTDDVAIIFRTRKAAVDYVREKNKKSKRYTFHYPKRATWGPDN